MRNCIFGLACMDQGDAQVVVQQPAIWIFFQAAWYNVISS